MSSNEKVMAHLNDALQVVADDDDPKGSVAVEIWAVRDALEMLKEQEAAEPKKESDDYPGSWWYVCGNCGGVIDWHDMYCRHCGRVVKWK